MSGQRLDSNNEVSASRVRLTAFIAFAVYILTVNAGITQWLASRLHYHSALGGRPMLGLYPPFAWLGWQRWYSAASESFNIAYIALLILIFAGIVTCVIGIGVRLRSAKQNAGVHGTAHWASIEEIRQTTLLPQPGQKGKGVYVGGWTDPKTKKLHYLRHDGPEHVAAIAPTRSGKGVTLVIPTALSWPGSMLVNDMKGEIHALTSGWRSTEGGNVVLKFDPAAESGSVSFNPLEEIRVGGLTEVGEAQNIANIIMDPDGKGLESHWQKTGGEFLVGLILYQLYLARAKGQTAALSDLAFAIKNPAMPVEKLYNAMLGNKLDEANHYGFDQLHPTIAGAGRGMLDKPEEERGSVLSTVASYLSLYDDPIVRRNTSRSDFRIHDLMNADKPVTLYIIVSADDQDRMRPLMRLIITQVVRVLLRDPMKMKDGRQVTPHKHRLLMLLDEFPALGKLEVFKDSLGYIAGYGIKAYLIMQDIAQLWSAYGKDETITSNCHIRTAFAPNKVETAEWLSKLTGTMTELKWQITESGKRFAAIADQFQRSGMETSRPLMTPDEAMRLRAPVRGPDGSTIITPGDLLVCVAGHAPIHGTQSLFFRDPTFLARSRIEAPTEAVAAPSDATPTLRPATNERRDRLANLLWDARK